MLLNLEAVNGLNLGIVSNLRIGEYWDLRFIPRFVFCTKKPPVQFKYPDSDRERIMSKILNPIYLEISIRSEI